MNTKGAALAALVLGLALVLGGCASADWQLRMKDTPENWAGVQMACKRHGYPVPYVREQELLTRREVTGNAWGGAWTRMAAKRDGQWIYFRGERWGRGGFLWISWWSFGGQEDEKQKKVFLAVKSEPGAALPEEWRDTWNEEGWIKDDPVECPDDAPEYDRTEDFYSTR